MDMFACLNGCVGYSLSDYRFAVLMFVRMSTSVVESCELELYMQRREQ